MRYVSNKIELLSVSFRTLSLFLAIVCCCLISAILYLILLIRFCMYPLNIYFFITKQTDLPNYKHTHTHTLREMGKGRKSEFSGLVFDSKGIPLFSCPCFIHVELNSKSVYVVHIIISKTIKHPQLLL